MIIIVEGIDRVGKSTFCKMLQQKGYTVLDSKIHTSKAEVGEDVYDMLQEERTIAQAQLLALLDKSEKIVIDRFHLSQIVYGYYDRHRDNSVSMLLLEDLLIRNSILVLIRPTDVFISSQQHGSDLTDHHNYFDKLFELSSLTKIRGSYNDLDKLVYHITEVLEHGN